MQASNTRRSPFRAAVERAVPNMLFGAHHHPVALAAIAAASVVLAVGCGTTDDATSPPADAGDPLAPASTSTSTSFTTDPPTTATTTSSPGTTTDQSTTTTDQPTTTATSPTGSIQVPIPAGNFESGPTDLFVLSRNGDLERWSEALVPPVGRRTLVADYPDPFGPVNEGSGPNVVDHVAGELGGTVVFGDCCEPISGNILAATDPGEVALVGAGAAPTLSPTGDLLGTANDYVISQTSTDRTGEGTYRVLDQGPQGTYLHVADLTWSSNATATADDDHLVLLAWTDDGWWLHDVDRSTLEPTPAVDLGVPPVPAAPDTFARFVGHGPGGEVVVAVRTESTTRLRYFAPATLTELPTMERSLPGSATSIRLADDGVGLLWVDDGVLYHLPAGEFEADRLGDGVLAAWFA